MQKASLINDLMMLSPAIDVRINELASSAMQDEFDMNTTTTTLLDTALSMLIEMLDENGIKFHVDDDMLLSDSYNIDFIIQLHRQFTPQTIENYLTENINICRAINANVVNVSSEEFVVHLLEAVRDADRSGYSNEMYAFLHDKIQSTERYATEVTAILNRVYARSHDDTLVKLDDNDMAFLMKLTAERTWYQNCMNKLMYNNATLNLNFKQSSWLSSQFRSAYSLPSNINILARYEEMIVTNREMVAIILQRVRTGSNFYVDHYTDEGIHNLSLEMVLGIILAQLSDQRLFGIEPKFQRLTDNIPSIRVDDIIRMITAPAKVN